jgi:hypothetical protein
MDKFEKLYLEKFDSTAEVRKAVEEILSHMHASANRILKLEMVFHNANNPILADYSKELMQKQLQLVGSLQNHLERYYPTIYSDKNFKN